MTDKTLKITAIPVADAARLLASAFGRQITQEQVREVAESGGLIRADDTLSLLEYTAYLIHELASETSRNPEENSGGSGGAGLPGAGGEND